MSRIGIPLLTLAVLAFVASAMIHAFGPDVPGPADPVAQVFSMGAPGLADEAPAIDLPRMFLRPASPALLGLLAASWAALAYHVLRLWLEGGRQTGTRPGAAPPQGAGAAKPGDPARPQRPDGDLREHAPLTLALLAGTFWPWLLPHYPLAGFLLSAVTLAGALVAALRGVRLGPVVARSSTLGFFAGWALLVGLAAFAGLLEARLGVPQQAGAVIALLIGAVAAVGVQLRIPRRIGFSVALIWGLIGIAADTVATDAAIATATVIATAIIAVALVRVTT